MAVTLGNRTLRDRLVLGLAIVVLWQLMAAFTQYWVFPSIPEMLGATYQAVVDPQFDTYAGQLVDTFRRLLAGFVLSVLLGGGVGTLMGLRDDVESFFRPWVVFGLSVPAIAVAFGLVIAIGISEWVPVLTVTIVGVPFVMLNMWEGAQDLDQDIEQMAAFYGVSRYQWYRDVLFPQVLQYLFPSMYWALVVSWKVLFIAEVFGAGSGVGFMVNYWFSQQRVDMLLGWVLVPVLVVIVAQEGLQALEHRVMAWR
jgi:NitT/TauT family transport system permease protein